MLAKTADLFCSVMSIFCSNLFKSYICRDAKTILYTSACYTGIAVHDGVLMFFLLATIPCLMAGLPQPCIRALTSRIVDNSEQGK